MAVDDLVRIVAFQGQPGANSDLACRSVFPGVTTLPCTTFEDAFAALVEGEADRAMIPIENSVAGRVADVHQLIPHAPVHIVGEYFLRVHHNLMAPPGATLESLREVRSHIQALQQCRTSLRSLGLKAVTHVDTAGAAADIAALADPSVGALAPSLAAEIYGLNILRPNLEDAPNNTTRFLILSRVAQYPEPGEGKSITTIVFRVRNVSAALYKALGGFATNGINLTKLESYMVHGRFVAAQFYLDAEGHPDERPMRMALEELRFFTRELKILGVYPAHPFRDGIDMAD